jgi:hypothetical protein
MDAAVVGNIVAEVGHRRLIDWRNPDCIYTKPGKMVKPRDDAAQVANSVAIAVMKRAWVNLIDDR